MIDETQWAWLAGIIEGEGCIHVDKRGYGSITVKMSDRDIIQRIADMLEQKMHSAKRREAHHKPVCGNGEKACVVRTGDR